MEQTSERPAALALARILPPDKGCDRQTYTTYVASVLPAPAVTLSQIADLCKVYGCAADKVISAGAIVKDRLPTKGRKA